MSEPGPAPIAGAPTFTEVADGVYVLRYPVLDVNATLVVGGQVAVVVDTLSTGAQAHELLGAVRRITDLPLAIVNTHSHFDHCFGNDTLVEAVPGTGIWAHEEAARIVREEGSIWHRELVEHYRTARPEFAEELAQVRLRPPDRTVHTESIMDIGGRDVQLRHYGRGHTAGDLTLHVPQAGVVLAGDLLEQGAPPSFGDAFPLEWPETVAAMLHDAASASVVVPGHGGVVDLDFARAQHTELSTLAWLIREGHADGAPADEVAARSPFGPAASLPAVTRGYSELDGKL